MMRCLLIFLIYLAPALRLANKRFIPPIPDIEEDFSRAFGSKIAHTFTTGLEIGVLKGIEKRKKEHKGEYIVKYPSEQKPYWHNLSKGEYGADRYWVLLKK